MTPNIAIVRIERPYGRGFRLWLPLFLLWIPAILLSPVILLVLFGLCVAGNVSLWRAIAASWAILCGLPGTDVHVRTEGNQILVRIL
ncbi:MAG: hypothetical protein ABSD72_12785 [Terracidiphilus sp.]